MPFSRAKVSVLASGTRSVCIGSMCSKHAALLYMTIGYPDRPVQKFRALKSADRHFFCSPEKT